MMERYPVYVTLRHFVGYVEARSKAHAEEIVDQPSYPLPVTDWEELISIEAEEP